MQSNEYKQRKSLDIKSSIWHPNRTQKQKKKIVQYKNGEADKAAKEAIDKPGMITTRLHYTDYYLAIKRARNTVENGVGK